MLQVFHQQARLGAQAEVVPSGAAVPACARDAKRAQQQARSTKLYGRGCRHGAQSCIHVRLLFLSPLIPD
jgi:hypothetical protein